MSTTFFSASNQDLNGIEIFRPSDENKGWVGHWIKKMRMWARQGNFVWQIHWKTQVPRTVPGTKIMFIFVELNSDKWEKLVKNKRITFINGEENSDGASLYQELTSLKCFWIRWGILSRLYLVKLPIWKLFKALIKTILICQYPKKDNGKMSC